MATTSDGGIGARIRRLRGKLMTQQQLADAASVSIDLIRKLEQGRRNTASVGSLQRIARALDIDLGELLAKPGSLPSGDPDAGVVAIRRALTTVDDLVDEPVLEGEPLVIREAQRIVQYAWGAYWAGKYDELGALLPSALIQLRATAFDSPVADQAKTRELLARGYWVTGSTLVHLGRQDLAYLAVRQALGEANHGDDALLTAVLHNSVAWHLLVQGRYAESVRVAVRSANAIEPAGDVLPAHLSVYGSLLVTAATSAGRNRNGEQARDFLAAGAEVAGRIGYDRHDYETPFGPSQVTMQTVDVHVVTDEFGAALAAAKRMPRDAGLPLAARARHLADRAYAHARLGQGQQSLDALLAAERIGPDWIKYQSLPRQVVADLIEHERRIQSPLRGLAKRLGVTGN
jgi:transcriptional regulator with XRE-family HTH domain